MFWTLPDDSKAQDQLTVNRWNIILAVISGLATGIVLIRTHQSSKLAYLYTINAVILLSVLF